MNLKNGQITVGELLDNPAAVAVLQKHLGQRRMKHPLANAARSLTLQQAATLAAAVVPKNTVDSVLRELQAL